MIFSHLIPRRFVGSKCEGTVSYNDDAILIPCPRVARTVFVGGDGMKPVYLCYECAMEVDSEAINRITVPEMLRQVHP